MQSERGTAAAREGGPGLAAPVGRFDRGRMKATAAALAAEGVYIGTSSWKYPGWAGQLYEAARYEWHGRFAQTRFERNCLREYAEVFKTVCVDAAYYTFPTVAYLEGLAAQVPEDFQFGFKVTDRITVKRFPKLERFGPRAGQVNADYLNAELFAASFLGPCRSLQSRVGLLIFEFSRFHPGEYRLGRDFVADLDVFLGGLPGGWRYGVEIRNPAFLRPEYFAALARHGVAHIYNSWQAMPPVEEQMALPGSRTHPELVGARLLLRPGRRYEEAVKRFSPYREVQDPYPAGRAAGAELVRQARGRGGAARGFIFVNNRLEGNALGTIAAIVEQAGDAGPGAG
jgi:uncharacterized protein YecE (DUF72 family)